MFAFGSWVGLVRTMYRFTHGVFTVCFAEISLSIRHEGACIIYNSGRPNSWAFAWHRIAIAAWEIQCLCFYALLVHVANPSPERGPPSGGASADAQPSLSSSF
jgi:hypothetical protein